MTRDKAIEIITSIWPKLAVTMNTYELNGNNAGQRDKDNENYGQVDLAKCVDGNNCANFIYSANEFYLLYWWNKLDKEGFVQFTLN